MWGGQGAAGRVGGREAIGEMERETPPLVSALRKEGADRGRGPILTSAQSRQKSFKVLSERLIETSKGRKLKAHPRTPPAPPRLPSPQPRASDRAPGPMPGAQGAVWGLGFLVSYKKPQTKPRNPAMGWWGGKGSQGGPGPLWREKNVRKEGNLRKRYPRFCDASYIYICIYIYRYRYLYIDRFSFFVFLGGWWVIFFLSLCLSLSLPRLL